MFPKKNKLSRNDFTGTSFTGTSFTGTKIHTPLFTLIYNSNPNSELKIGIIASKKISKKAVDRNTLKRKLYSTLEKVINKTTPLKLLFIVKPQIKLAKPEDILKTLSKSLTNLKSSR